MRRGRAFAIAACVLLAPVLIGPSCSGHTQQEPPAPDSKRAIRKSRVLSKALVVKDGQKALPAHRLDCSAHGPQRVLPLCAPLDEEEPETVSVGAGEKFRVLTGVDADSVAILGVPSGFDPYGHGQVLPTLPLLARGRRADKAGHRWDFRLSRDPAYPELRIQVMKDGSLAAFDIAVEQDEDGSP